MYLILEYGEKLGFMKRAVATTVASGSIRAGEGDFGNLASRGDN